MLDEPLVPLPPSGRVYRGGRKVRLADASPSQRLRLDACARYLQDIGNDDTADSGLDETAGRGAGIWVVRRAVVDVVAPPRWGDWVDLATWCSGTGGRWAERRLSVTSEDGRAVEVTTLWVHLDPVTLAPARLPETFMGLYGEAAQGRRVSARHWLSSPPADQDGLVGLAWPLRATDFDVMGHVNNAAYWAAIEEVLAAHRDHPAHPTHGHPVRAVLEFGAGIPRDAEVTLLIHQEDKALDVWFAEDDIVHATARLFELSS